MFTEVCIHPPTKTPHFKLWKIKLGNNYKYSIKLTHMRYPLQYFSKLFLRKKRTNKFKPVIIPQELSTRNKWLYPEDNYGKLERGVE